MREVYINPFTDFGFKKLFGEESSTEFLIDFLNSFLPEDDKIEKLSFHRNEHYARSPEERKAIFDLFCQNEKGEKFIIELQRGEQINFVERTIYYSTFPIQEQAEPGRAWDFNLKAVYSIGILNFLLDPKKFPEEDTVHTMKLTNVKTKEVMYDKLSYIYVEAPKMKKHITELETPFEKWLYLLRHLPEFEKRPVELQERIFKRFFEKAKLSKLEPVEAQEYESSLKAFRDYYNTVQFAEYKGQLKAEKKAEIEIAKERELREEAQRKQQEAQKKQEEEQKLRVEAQKKQQEAENRIYTIAKSLFSTGMSFEEISSNTGLEISELKRLLDS